MRRDIKKQFRITEKENQELKEKAAKCCMTESGLIRVLLHGYEPKACPPEVFFTFIEELRSIHQSLRRFLEKESLTYTDWLLLRKELEILQKVEIQLKERFLCPEKAEEKWQ